MTNLTPLHHAVSGHMVQAISQLGAAGFYQNFLNWIREEFDADHFTAFFYRDKKDISPLICKDFSEDYSDKSLAKSYIEQGLYKDDPNFERLKDIRQGQTKVFYLQSFRDDMSENYRNTFFDQPKFIDKVSILHGSAKGNFYINIYRRKHKHSCPQSYFNDNQTAQLIATILEQHYAFNDKLMEEGPLTFLSKREQQVCKATLQGKKTEAIADELSIAATSVVTYRKRAYDKLSISSRGQLFALCVQT